LRSRGNPGWVCGRLAHDSWRPGGSGPSDKLQRREIELLETSRSTGAALPPRLCTPDACAFVVAMALRDWIRLPHSPAAGSLTGQKASPLFSGVSAVGPQRFWLGAELTHRLLLQVAGPLVQRCRRRPQTAFSHLSVISGFLLMLGHYPQAARRAVISSIDDPGSHLSTFICRENCGRQGCLL